MNKMIFYLIIFFLAIGFVRANLIEYANDNFECNDFNCEAIDWIDQWQTSGDCEIKTQNAMDNYNLRGDDNCNAYREFSIDPNIYSYATLSFYATAKGLERKDECKYYYFNGNDYNLLLTLDKNDDDQTHREYSYNLNQYGLSKTARLRMVSPSGESDFCYLDNIVIKTEEIIPEVNIFVEDSYLKGNTYKIEASSDLTNEPHIIELMYSNGSVFCSYILNSPDVASTPFSTYCYMGEIDSFAVGRVKSMLDDNVVDTKNFRITNPVNDKSMLNIEKVYFSNQVLQGGSMEIFAVLEHNPNLEVDKITVNLEFPDGSSRVFSMTPTVNKNEFKAFITDTYQVGFVEFEVISRAGIFYDTYENYYNVIEYNVDFVQLVSEVSQVMNVKNVEQVESVSEVNTVEKILTPSLNLHGTEYTSNKPGKVFLQLLDADKQPITNSSCFVSIYYPNNQPWKYQQFMTYLDEGLYVYDFITPHTEGNYPASAFCTSPALAYENTHEATDGFESNDKTGGSGWENNWDFDHCNTQSTYAIEGTYALECDDDNKPKRKILSNSTFSTLNYDFWYMATSLESSETVYVYLKDANGVKFNIFEIIDGFDDGVWRQVTGTLSTSNDGFDFNGSSEFKLETSEDLEGDDYYYIDDIEITLFSEIEINETEYQFMRGSSEVHISGDSNYRAELNKGIMTANKTDSVFGDFTFEFIITSKTNENLSNQEIQLHLPSPFYCENIYNVSIVENETYTNISYVGISSNDDDCVINIERDLNFGENIIVHVLTDNQWKKTLYSSMSIMRHNLEIINQTCQHYVNENNLKTIVTPINETPNGETELWLSCAYYLDGTSNIEYLNNLFEPFLNINFNFTTDQMNTLEYSFLHLEEIQSRIEGNAISLMVGLNLMNSYSTAFLNGNYNNPALNYFSNISSSNQIPENVWSWKGEIEDNILTKIGTKIWNFVGRYIHGEILS